MLNQFRLRRKRPLHRRWKQIATGPGDLASGSRETPPDSDSPLPSLQRKHRSGRLFRGTVGVTAAALAAVSFYSLWGLLPAGRAPTGRPSLAVEEVRDYSDDVARPGFAHALTIETLGRLAQVEGLTVVAPNSESTTSVPADRGFALRTGLIRSGDSLRVAVVLLDAGSGVAINRATTNVHFGDQLVDIDELAAWLATFVRSCVGARLADLQRAGEHPRGRALELTRAALHERARADSLGQRGALDAALTTFTLADSLLRQAEEADPDWSEPAVQRAETALLRMWVGLLHADIPEGHRVAVGQSAGYASFALSRFPKDPAALEISAVSSYWLWRTAPVDSPAGPDVPLRIERDLRSLLELDPTRPRAWTMLGALLQSRGAFAEARSAAERARRADSFLQYDTDNLARLFDTSLETGDLLAARHWCHELARTFKGTGVQGYCELMLLAYSKPDPRNAELARATLRELAGDTAISPPWGPRLHALVAVVLARAGEIGSAREVLARAERQIAHDPELMPLVAWALLHSGDSENAAVLLRQYVAARPFARRGILASERFRDLRTRELMTLISTR